MAVAASEKTRMANKKLSDFHFERLDFAGGIKISRNLFNQVQTNEDQLNENLFDMDGSEQLDGFR